MAERVSKSRTTITNSMRLLKLDARVQQMIVDEQLSTGHARALITISNPEKQYDIAQKVFDEKLSVRDVEKLVKNLDKPPVKKEEKETDEALLAVYREIAENLKQKLQSKVTITPSAKVDGSGKLEIEFYNHDDLEKIIDLLNKAQ